MTNGQRLAVLAGAVWVASVSGLVFGAVTWWLDRWDEMQNRATTEPPPKIQEDA